MGKEVLVTGGLGFIGAETTLALVREGYEPVIVDSLVNSKIRNLGALESLSGKKIPFYQGDVRDEALMDKVFSEHSFEAVLHFAALKAVGESVTKPVLYYQNNLGCTLSVLRAMERHGVRRVLFSSSATVYGDSEDLPFREDSPVREATNPYGETKVMNERMLRDYLVPHPETEVVCLRYFNPVGADPSGLLGEDPNGIPNNLFPIINQVALGIREGITVYGKDYGTEDGTCVRDYLHVVDLAEGHVAALSHSKGPGFHVYNLGTGHGTSVLEVIHAYEKATGRKIPYEIGPRRPGDIAVSYADPSRAEQELHWKARLTIEDAARDAHAFATKVLKEGD